MMSFGSIGPSAVTVDLSRLGRGSFAAVRRTRATAFDSFHHAVDGKSRQLVEGHFAVLHHLVRPKHIAGESVLLALFGSTDGMM
jgi:hypothetical protein